MRPAAKQSNSKGRHLVGIILLIVVAASGAFAVTLDGYKEQIDATKTRVNDLLVTVGKAESGARDTASENAVIKRIQTGLPASEPVDWPGGTVDTSNQWLYDSLEAFAKEDNSTKRALIMTAANDRLSAIGEKVDELRKPSVAGRSKDEDKQKLGEILRREEYQKPEQKEESWIRGLVRRFFNWLDSLFPKPKIEPATDTAGFDGFKVVLQVLLYAAIIGIVGFLIYRFAPFLAGRFAGRGRSKKGDRIILGERIGEDESSDDLFAEAERLARDGDLRGAIRKGYVALLCELSDRKIIGLARHKTNRDYLRDMRRNESLFANMRTLTGSFEQNWYGLKTTEAADWENFRQGYRQTVAVAAAEQG